MNTIDKIREKINKVTLDATFKAQQKYGFEIGTGPHSTWNNEADAFKHTYMQWYLSYYHGKPIAKILGDFHELETWNGPKNERNMDLWNNSVGREIAQKMKKIPELMNKSPEEISEIASRIIYEKMRNGELITSPDDVRKFNFFTGKREPAPEQQPQQNNISNPNKKAENLSSDSKYHNRIFGGHRVVNGRDEVYVKEYKRGDGTVVKAQWRSYPGDFDPDKRLTDMQEPELGHALDFWMDEEKFA